MIHTIVLQSPPMNEYEMKQLVKFIESLLPADLEGKFRTREAERKLELLRKYILKVVDDSPFKKKPFWDEREH